MPCQAPRPDRPDRACGLRTLVISDLHLGGNIGVDILRRAENRDVLKAVLPGCDRLVLLGDTLELRQCPEREVMPVALEALADVASALEADAEVVVVAGNHDHRLVADWLDGRKRTSEPAALEPEQRFGPVGAGELAQAVADALGSHRTTFAYPGLWLRADVYAFHGHYLDRHIDIPTFERLAAGLMAHVTGRPLERSTGVDDYEAVLAPMYAWSHAVAQQADSKLGPGAHGASKRAWEILGGGSGHRPVRRRLVNLAFAGAVGALNLARLGPLRADISPQRLRLAGIESVIAAAAGIGVAPAHLIHGHTHRPGPLPGDAPAEWTAPSGMRVWNQGSWVFEDHFLAGARQGSPYWPGRMIEVTESGPPRLLSLLDGHSRSQIVGAMHPRDEYA